jgi:hypothetical protein
MTYGFILTRHVNSELTNKYWNKCIQQLQKIYPEQMIVIIDDNSKQEFIKAECDYDYTHIKIVQSEYLGRGELLPYYYFYKNKYFDNAIIIHDSVFFQKKILFKGLEKSGIKVFPLWSFDYSKQENMVNSIRLIHVLKNNYKINELMTGKNKYSLLGLNNDEKWTGCFGVQSYINHGFLSFLQNKYQIFNLLQVVKNRPDRCCLERIFGIIFYLECPILSRLKSILGPINKYCKWGTSYEEYSKTKLLLPVVKVWTGR